jgi:hypothetical protein
VFNELLHQAGLTRAECAIENTVRTPIADIDLYLGKKGLTEKGREAQADLFARLEKRSAKVLLPMGNLALCALSGNQQITKRRGSLQPSLLPNRMILPTIHPAATLEGRGPYTARYMISWDMKKAARYANEGPPNLDRTLLTRPSHAEVMAHLELCLDSKHVAFDIECLNNQVSCISFAPSPKLSMCIPILGLGGSYWPEHDEARIWRGIASLLYDKRVGKIAQNAMFDVSFLLLVYGIFTRGTIHDTMIAQRVLYPDFPSSLEFICSAYTDEPYYKDDRKIWSRPEKDIDRFYLYNAKDSSVCHEAWERGLLPELLKNESDLQTYRMTMANFEPCLYAMCKGIKIERDELEKTKVELKAELAVLEGEMKAVQEGEFNWRSSAQCIKYFYGTKGLKPYINRKTGNPTCDDIALSRIVRRDNLEEARILQRLRSLDKLLGTYVESAFDADDRLRCFYNPRGTTTGRLSSSKTVFDTGLNMQNLHPRFKYFLVPD